MYSIDLWENVTENLNICHFYDGKYKRQDQQLYILMILIKNIAVRFFFRKEN